MAEPCETCDCSHLPICAGESCPALCLPAHAAMRHRLSMDASRSVGWPNASRVPIRETPAPVEEPPYVHPSEMPENFPEVVDHFRVPVIVPPMSIDAAAIRSRFARSARHRPDLGVICGGEASAFVGMKLMISSVLLSHDVPITAFDLGMAPDQVAWLESQGVSVVAPELPAGHRFEERDNRWSLWIKPVLLGRSPYDRTVWLDSDVVVDRDLSPLAGMIQDRGVAIFPDAFGKLDAVMNRPELYESRPVPRVFSPVNSGVIGFAKSHPFIRLARKLLRDCVVRPEIRPLVACWDQGLIKWALERLEIPPIDDATWNSPGWTAGEVLGHSYSLKSVLSRVKPGTIAHFQGTPKPWHRWEDFEIDLSHRPKPRVPLGQPHCFPCRGLTTGIPAKHIA